jgi:hypothetical protein
MSHRVEDWSRSNDRLELRVSTVVGFIAEVIVQFVDVRDRH